MEKQARLFEREARMWHLDEGETYFQEGERACKRGLDLWQDVETRRRPEIDVLLTQLEAIRESMRFEWLTNWSRKDTQMGGREWCERCARMKTRLSG